LKLQNLVFDQNFDLKITDLGISRPVTLNNKPEGYMAPEMQELK
jgi:serine/threonine protein kinase